MKAKLICYDEIKDDFRINAVGQLERLNMRDHKWHVIKNVANCHDGYCKLRWRHRDMLYHRVLWVIHFKQDLIPDLIVDHKDGVKLNNCIDNYRLGTYRNNLQNKQCHRDGHLVGTCWVERCQKWSSHIWIKKTGAIHLGYYATAIEAHLMYRKACQYIDQYTNNTQFRMLLNG